MTLPLNILAFFDSRPGHDKQTHGVLKALSLLTSTSITYHSIPVTRFSQNIRDWFNYYHAMLIDRPRRTFGNSVDILIGTGTHTHIPMLLNQKCLGGRVVTCMSPSGLLRKKFDLCLIPQHDCPKMADNVFLTIGPPGINVNQEVHHRQKGLILIGGVDKRSHYWDSSELLIQIKAILQQKPTMKWTISSSPRTPAETSMTIRQMALDHSNVIFFSSDETSKGWIEKSYNESETVWVTADSISMVYEALSSGCSVGLLPVQWKRKHSKFKRSVDYLIENNYVVTYQMWMGGQPMVKSPSFDEAKRCAKEILRRWWPDRLQ